MPKNMPISSTEVLMAMAWSKFVKWMEENPDAYICPIPLSKGRFGFVCFKDGITKEEAERMAQFFQALIQKAEEKS